MTAQSRAKANARSNASNAAPISGRSQPRGLTALPSNQMVQRKLRVGRTDDPLEREADRAADAVVADRAPPAISTAPAVAQRACAGCEAKETKRRHDLDNDESDEEPMVQAKLNAGTAAPSPPPASADAGIGSLGGGSPLPASERAYFEPRFGHDFSDVRLHTDAKAAESASALNARAYTHGRDVVFAADQYSPGRPDSRRLLAHELAHTIQQDNTSDTPDVQRLGDLSKVPPGLSCPVPSSSSAMTTIADILFPVGGSTLSNADKGAIDAFIGSWQALGGNTPVQVDGFASTDGTDETNWTLSCDRALAVRNELETPSSGIAGVPAALLTVFAQGETSQFGTALPPNRRATISVPTPPPPVTCPAGAAAQTRMSGCVQPVSIAEDDGSSPTALPSFTDVVDIWGRCCIDITVNSPVTVNGTRFKEIEDAGSGAAPTQEEQDMFDAVGSSGTCVEVFIVDTIRRGSTASKAVAGGGTTKLTGTADPKIIAVEGVVSSVVAHELGHAFGVGHGLGVRADGTNTVMQPTGAHDRPAAPNVSSAICTGVRGNQNVTGGTGAATCCEDLS